MTRAAGVAVLALLLAATAACDRRPSSKAETLRAYPLDSLEGIVTLTGAAYDSLQSTDGRGSLRYDVKAPTTIRLVEAKDPGVEAAVLYYRAALRVQDFEGKAYLEMWVRVPGMGEFFSKGFQSTLSGTSGWMSVEIPFVLREGQRADLVRLNVVADGTGTLWVDDLRLLAGELPPQP